MGAIVAFACRHRKT